MPLVLDSLEIKNFRAFKHLRIEKLGRVNLIVGKNNVGKSSVLDALVLYACRGNPYMIFAILRERYEIPSEDVQAKHFRRSVTDAQERASSLRFLFHGRQDIIANTTASIAIGPADDLSDNLVVGILWPFDVEYIDTKTQDYADVIEHLNNSIPRISVKLGDEFAYQFPLDQDYRSRIIQTRRDLGKLKYVFVSAYGMQLSDIAAFWDNVALSDLENNVLTSLQVIAPEVLHLNFVGNEGPDGERIPKVRVSGVDGPIPLRSMGEGMNRMLGIALALVNAKDGMLLIDEVDTGLHYSVLPDLWKLIFEVAHRLNVQVFATSHSWDCIQAFQQAAASNENEEGILIRLEERKTGVGAVVFDERDLAIVTREQIEVR